ncbi:MAG: helix-turn-helix domain-containing protein [Deltaproteobacteria bacterium]|nr:helix-turn-helix domain-containing protein [Deltaproteobacteria bacterium]
MDCPPKYFVQSLARGLSILQAFTSERKRLTLTELAEITHMNRTAVQRFTCTLMALGYLGRDDHKAFFLSSKVLSLGFTYLQSSEIIQLTASHLKDFSERIGLTVNMAILDGTDIVFLYRHEVHRFLKYDLRAGSRLPSYCTASGKVLLAALKNEALRARIRNMSLEKTTSHTIIDEEQLFQEILKTRETGIGVCDRELSLSLYSIAVPLLNHEQKMVAAINLSLSSEDATPSAVENATYQIVEQGRNVSEVLGYQGAYPVIP